MADADTLWRDIVQIRTQAPLIHNITNYVVMNTTANALLALGASPVMAHAIEEVEAMVGIARALVLNMGTLSVQWVESMLRAGKEANRLGIPVVFDPVGCGATPYRTETAARLLREVSPTIIRGNASEIMALAFHGSGTKGVDSTQTPEACLDTARMLAQSWRCVVSVSGPTDLIVDADQIIQVANGRPMMPRVTGMGCTATALTAAFAATNPVPLEAATHAMALMGIAGEMAGENAPGPATLQLNFLDTLYQIQKTDLEQRLNLKAQTTPKR